MAVLVLNSMFKRAKAATLITCMFPIRKSSLLQLLSYSIISVYIKYIYFMLWLFIVSCTHVWWVSSGCLYPTQPPWGQHCFPSRANPSTWAPPLGPPALFPVLCLGSHHYLPGFDPRGQSHLLTLRGPSLAWLQPPVASFQASYEDSLH